MIEAGPPVGAPIAIQVSGESIDRLIEMASEVINHRPSALSSASESPPSIKKCRPDLTQHPFALFTIHFC